MAQIRDESVLADISFFRYIWAGPRSHCSTGRMRQAPSLEKSNLARLRGSDVVAGTWMDASLGKTK